jgi:hypothetical protein
VIFWIFVLDSVSHSWSVPMIKKKRPLHALSRKTCKIVSVSNTCSPHCISLACLKHSWCPTQILYKQHIIHIIGSNKPLCQLACYHVNIRVDQSAHNYLEVSWEFKHTATSYKYTMLIGVISYTFGKFQPPRLMSDPALVFVSGRKSPSSLRGIKRSKTTPPRPASVSQPYCEVWLRPLTHMSLSSRSSVVTPVFCPVSQPANTKVSQQVETIRQWLKAALVG